MLSENEPKFTRFEDKLLLILGVIFIAAILVTICDLSVMLLNQQKEPPKKAQQDIPEILLPDGISADSNANQPFFDTFAYYPVPVRFRI